MLQVLRIWNFHIMHGSRSASLQITILVAYKQTSFGNIGNKDLLIMSIGLYVYIIAACYHVAYYVINMLIWFPSFRFSKSFTLQDNKTNTFQRHTLQGTLLLLLSNSRAGCSCPHCYWNNHNSLELQETNKQAETKVGPSRCLRAPICQKQNSS